MESIRWKGTFQRRIFARGKMQFHGKYYRSIVKRSYSTDYVHGPVCFIGDIHGYVDKLRSLWERLPAHCGGEDAFETANVVFLGDYCDKGPDTASAVDWLLQLQKVYTKQKHHFLCGNHDFALSAFLGLLPMTSDGGENGKIKNRTRKGKREGIDTNATLEGIKQYNFETSIQPAAVDLSSTWREGSTYKSMNEDFYQGPGHETMHLQGVRYAARGCSVFDSHATFASYGVEYGDRAGLLAAMPQSHLDFFTDTKWIVKLRSNVGDVIAVHAGLEDLPLTALDQMTKLLDQKSSKLLKTPFIEALCGRENVERMPKALLQPVLRQHGYTPPPLFLVSGHHGFVCVNGRRIVVDMCCGMEQRDLAAVVFTRGTCSKHYMQSDSDYGLQIEIVTSK